MNPSENIFYNWIHRFKHEKNTGAVRFNDHHPYNWIAQFSNEKPNDEAIELHNHHCNKITCFKSKLWQGASLGICNKCILIVLWKQVFTNMSIDIHDASQIKFGKCKG